MTQSTELIEYKVQTEEREPSEYKKAKLELIAKKIKEEIITVKSKIYNIGKLLNKAKEILDHGQFQKWVEQRFQGDLPYPTAWLYAKIYAQLGNRPHFIEYFPLHILMDIRNYPIEVLKLIEQKPDEFKECHNEVRDLFKCYKHKEIDIVEFVDKADELLGTSLGNAQAEQVKQRLAERRQVYKKHLIERLKIQLGAVFKTFENLEELLKVEVPAEERDAMRDDVRVSLASDIDMTILGMVRLKELFSNNDRLVTILNQYSTMPYSEDDIRMKNKRVPMILPSSKL